MAAGRLLNSHGTAHYIKRRINGQSMQDLKLLVKVKLMRFRFSLR